MACSGLEAYLTARCIFFPDKKTLSDSQRQIIETAENLILHAIEDHVRQTWECAEAIVRQDGLNDELLREKFLERAKAAKERAQKALNDHKKIMDDCRGKGLENPE